MRALRIVALALAVAGCAPGRGVVVVTVTSSGVVANVASLRVTVDNAGATAQPVDVALPGAPVSISAQATQDFALGFDSSRSGAATITVDALSPTGATLATGRADATINPSDTTRTTVTLPGAALGDGGLPPDFSTSGDGSPTPDAGGGGLAFAGARSYQTGQAPFDVAVGDFNSDGKLDVATANSNSGNVGFLYNQGAGMLAPATYVSVGGSPNGVTAGDINGDGHVDLVVPCGTSTVWTIRQVAQANPPFVATSYSSIGTPTKAAILDVDGDGAVDAVVADPNVGYALFYHGDPTIKGSFGGIAYSQIPIGGAVENVATADFNNDGKPDVAFTGMSSNQVLPFLNSGGQFTSVNKYKTDLGPSAIWAGDVDGDSIADLVVASFGGNSVDVFIGAANGSFKPFTSYAVGTNPTGVAVADFDGDGRLDIAAASSNDGTVSILINQGQGTFAPQKVFQATTVPQAIAAGDLDGDGKPDLVVTDVAANTVAVLINQTK